MKRLPDLTDTEAMAARGRRSALWSARKEAAEELRDAATVILHHDDYTDVATQAKRARVAIDRIEEIAKLMDAENSGPESLIALLQASIEQAKARA